MITKTPAEVVTRKTREIVSQMVIRHIRLKRNIQNPSKNQIKSLFKKTHNPWSQI